MAKYTFKYHSEEFGRDVIMERDFNALDSSEETLDELLDEFKLFLQAVTYSTDGIVNTIGKDNYIKVYEYSEKLKQDSIYEEN